ncbi:MAG: DKNYY domain-containing protein [Patescibacteria group bacterium]|jgi:hypothetical protein
MEFLNSFLCKIRGYISSIKLDAFTVLCLAFALVVAVPLFIWFVWLIFFQPINDGKPNDYYGSDRGYLKHADYVTLYGEPIIGSDPKTFKALPVAGFAKDKNNIYLGGKKLENIDYTTFSFVDEVEKTISLKAGLAVEKEYFKDKNNVFYYYFEYDGDKPKEMRGYIVKKIEGADPASFVMVNNIFAKDKNHVYEYDQILSGIDGETFELLNDNSKSYTTGYVKDKNNAYHIGFKNKGSQVKIINGVDLLTFKLLIKGESEELDKLARTTDNNLDYALDKNFIYLHDKKLFNVSTLTVYEKCRFVKDQDFVYFYSSTEGWQAINNADVQSFRQTNEECYMNDNSNLYKTMGGGMGENDVVIAQPGVDFETFEVIKDNNGEATEYAKDKNFNYFKVQKIEGSDVNSFKIFNYSLAKDNNNIYSYGKILAGADATSFEKKQGVLKGYGDYEITYYQDKDSIFLLIGEQRISLLRFDNENFEDIKILGSNHVYAKGKRNIYYLPGPTPVIINADYDSFEVVGDGFAKDKNNVFFYKTIIPFADTVTFVKEAYDKYKDKNAIFIMQNYLCIPNGGTQKLLRYENEDFANFKELAKRGCYYRGKDVIYFDDKVVAGADYDSFEGIDYSAYGKDKNYVYKEGKMVPNADPATFDFDQN